MKAARVLVVLLVLAAAGLLVAWLAGFFEPAPRGPVPVAWDRETCAECRMHIGDPAFAAQLQTEGGAVLNFDDPGCLFRYRQQQQPAAAALYFHHHEQQRWLPAGETAFVRVERSPMGYGLAAVAAGEGSMTLAQAQAAALEAF